MHAYHYDKLGNLRELDFSYVNVHANKSNYTFVNALERRLYVGCAIYATQILTYILKLISLL